MIYVLQSAGYDKNGQYIDLIKIGYASNWDRRWESYQLHNPTIKVLYTVEGGEFADEKNVQNYFRKYRFEGYGQEWFTNVKTISNFFEGKTIEDIRAIVPSMMSMSGGYKTLLGKFKNTFYDLISVITKVVFPGEFYRTDEVCSILADWRVNELPELIKVIKIEFPEYYDDILIMYDHIREGLSEKEIQFLDDYFNLKKSVSDNKKLRFICEYGLSEKEEKVFLFVEKKFRILLSYFDRREIKSYNYCVEKLIREYKVRTFSNISEVRNRIFEVFKVGDRMTYNYAKNTLMSIYKEFNYSKGVTSSEIKNYFEVRGMDDSKNNKARIRGYTIVRPIDPKADEIIEKQQEELRFEILNYFKVGDSIFVDDINEKLQKIYDKLGYQKRPAPRQLDNFFELKVSRKYYKIKRCLFNDSNLYDNLKDDIYSTFFVDQILSNEEIEEKLEEIYKNNNYSMSPKASDINNWFKTRVRKVNFDAGLKLISRIQEN